MEDALLTFQQQEHHNRIVHRNNDESEVSSVSTTNIAQLRRELDQALEEFAAATAAAIPGANPSPATSIHSRHGTDEVIEPIVPTSVPANFRGHPVDVPAQGPAPDHHGFQPIGNDNPNHRPVENRTDGIDNGRQGLVTVRREHINTDASENHLPVQRSSDNTRQSVMQQSRVSVNNGPRQINGRIITPPVVTRPSVPSSYCRSPVWGASSMVSCPQMLSPILPDRIRMRLVRITSMMYRKDTIHLEMFNLQAMGVVYRCTTRPSMPMKKSTGS